MKKSMVILAVLVVWMVGGPVCRAFGAGSHQYTVFYPGNKSCRTIVQDMKKAMTVDDKASKKRLLTKSDLAALTKRSEERSWMHGYITALNFVRVSRGYKNLILKTKTDVGFENMVLNYCVSHPKVNLAAGTSATISNIFAQFKKRNVGKRSGTR